jgi:23S rRNA (adenine2503-C2)-methyltransferase
MGEPFHNIDNVLKASAIMVDEQGLHFSPRKVTVSTSGLVPQLRRFLHESKCALAVSLNATTDEVAVILLGEMFLVLFSFFVK